jgi:thioredoxin-related protein
MFRPVPFAFIIVFAISHWYFRAGQALAEEVKWQTDYRAARLEAAAKDRLLVIHITTDNCYWCKRLEAETLNNHKVAGLINERCVSLKVDAKRDPSLIGALRIKSYPTLVYATPDGRILKMQEGFLDPARFQEQLQRALNAVEAAEWLTNDYQKASQAIAASEFGQALTILKTLIADAKDRPIQLKAKQLVQEIEQQASDRLGHAKLLADRGRDAEAGEVAKEVLTSYAGAQAAKDAAQFQTYLAAKAAPQIDARTRQARELLAKAREDYGAGQYLACLDRCEGLVHDFGDLTEAGEAVRLAADIKANPEFLRQSCDRLGDRLGSLYLNQAEAWVKKDRPDQARQCLERVVRMFPGSRHAEVAQVRLNQLQEHTQTRVETQKQ